MMQYGVCRNGFLVAAVVAAFAGWVPLQAQVFHPSGAYTVEGGLVHDVENGVYWQRCAYGQSGEDCEQGRAEGVTYAEAIDVCGDLVLEGYDDWRLPTIYEAATFLRFMGDGADAGGVPYSNAELFPNTRGQGLVYLFFYLGADPYYFSELFEIAEQDEYDDERFYRAVLQAAYADEYRIVYWVHGELPSRDNTDQLRAVIWLNQRPSLWQLSADDPARVRCVRSNSPAPQPDFEDMADGTVFDYATGLRWEKCAAGQYGVGCSQGDVQLYELPEARQYCEDLTLAGRNDWRVPYYRELLSIYEPHFFMPGVDPAFFSTVDRNQVDDRLSSFYWTETLTADSGYDHGPYQQRYVTLSGTAFNRTRPAYSPQARHAPKVVRCVYGGAPHLR